MIIFTACNFIYQEIKMPKYPNIIHSKLPNVKTSIFTKMSALANQYNALNLSQGFPDFPVDNEIIELVYKHMKNGANQYAPMQGAMILREVISEKIEKLYQLKYCPEKEITITAGATEAIYSTIAAFIKEDDEVIIFTPAYDCYDPTVKLHGGKSIFVQLSSKDYSIDWALVKKVISHKTKMIIINTPHNPTGSVLSQKDMIELEKLVYGTEIIVLSDEVYEHIIFDQKSHQSACRFPKLASQTLAVFSFGKTFHVTGWKLGYIVGPENLMSEFRKVHQFNVFSCNNPIQLAVAEYLQNESNYDSLHTFYEQKRNTFLNAIKGSRFEPLHCSGTYFQLLSYKAISEEKDIDFAVKLTKEFGIASIPISVFYNSQIDDKVLRFCFAKEEETLEKAGNLLKTI